MSDHKRMLDNHTNGQGSRTTGIEETRIEETRAIIDTGTSKLL